MEIKDFVKEALLQIVDGVTSANEALNGKGATIPTKGLIGDGVLFKIDENRKESKHSVKVDLDLAVVLSQSESTMLDGSLKTSGEGKLKIAPFVKIGMGAGAKGSASSETQNENQTIHRIKFTIPLTLPDSPNE